MQIEKGFKLPPHHHNDDKQLAIKVLILLKLYSRQQRIAEPSCTTCLLPVYFGELNELSMQQSCRFGGLKGLQSPLNLGFQRREQMDKQTIPPRFAKLTTALVSTGNNRNQCYLDLDSFLMANTCYIQQKIYRQAVQQCKQQLCFCPLTYSFLLIVCIQYLDYLLCKSNMMRVLTKSLSFLAEGTQSFWLYRKVI